ncbi:hypothetical protein SELMODRAFT_422547 [Selaginella moellendorffii]|uniref:Uncharacterized protein n=1 Tax=Selaginella moellendorffii TaxID=88036 RepID=D8SIS6_SELML|nr:hypothetical protein SELMODRAFT_422547 [Selaginella moellendorffii]
MPEDAFPPLAVAAKPGGAGGGKKKSKGQTMTLAAFTTGKVVGPGAKRFTPSSSQIFMSDSNRLTSEELMFLPTGPKERTPEELSEQRLGGGFRGYGGFRGGDRDQRDRHPSRDPGFGGAAMPPPPSRADESSDWFSSKPAMMIRPSSRGSDRDAPSKADEVDDWKAGKRFVPSERSFGYGGRDGGGGGGRNSWSFRDPKPEMDRWSGGGDERKVAMERPRLNLQPRSLPVDSSRPLSSHSSRPGTPGDTPQVQVGSGKNSATTTTTTTAKPRSNPFGAAKPREVVLEERGQDWRKLDSELDQKRYESKEETRLKEEINALKDLIDKEGSEAAREELEKKELELEQLVKDFERSARVSDRRRSGGRDDPQRPPSSQSNRNGGPPEIWRRPPTPAMSDGGNFEPSGGWRRPRTPSSMHEGGEMGGGYRRGENGGRPRTPGFHDEEWRQPSWRDDRPKSAQPDMWSRPRTPSVHEDEWGKENGRRSSYQFHHQQQPSRNRWLPQKKILSFSASSSPSSVKIALTRSSDPSSFARSEPQHILVLADATKELNTDALSWTLELVAKPGDTVTFAGILPWLCLPLLVKRWSELRMIDEKSCTTREGEVQLKSAEFLRIQDSYRTKGVSLDIIIESGYPPRDVAVQLALKTQATWIICYRCMNKRMDQCLLFQKLDGKNIVFLKSKDEGSVSFAAKTPTAPSMALLYAREEPGFCSPHCELGHLGLQDIGSKGLKVPSHVTLGECLTKNKAK